MEKYQQESHGTLDNNCSKKIKSFAIVILINLVLGIYTQFRSSELWLLLTNGETRHASELNLVGAVTMETK